MSLDNQSQPLPSESYPAYTGGVFATPAKPQPQPNTITHLFESDDGLWYQAMECEIGYTMIREQAVEGEPWSWQYDLEPRVLKVNYILDSANGFSGPGRRITTPRPEDMPIWLSRAEWILKTNFREVDAAIRAGV